MDMNKVILTGRLTKDVILSKSANNVTYCRNDMAIKGPKEQTVFAPVTFYNKQAENLANFCRKGSRVMVEANYTTGSYTGQDGRKVYTHGFQVVQVYFLDQKQQGQQAPGGVIDNGDSYSFPSSFDEYPSGPALDINSDDLPF